MVFSLFPPALISNIIPTFGFVVSLPLTDYFSNRTVNISSGAFTRFVDDCLETIRSAVWIASTKFMNGAIPLSLNSV